MLQLFDGQLDKIRLQALLFLFSMKQSKPVYDFVPSPSGAYSYSVDADLTTMVAKGILQESKDEILKLDQTNYVNLLKPDDLCQLEQVTTTYRKTSTRTLIKHTYIAYPFYAIKSEIAEELLSKSELYEVEALRPHPNGAVLFTIGYEGISLEQYLTRLIVNDIKVLVDVRNNPLSMKFGFSKSRLKKYCENQGIQYVHIPELGIQSAGRQELNTEADRAKLFAGYRQHNLSNTRKHQTDVLNLLKENKRIALTCYEADVSQCHRKYLAEAIAMLPGFKYEIVHI